MTGTAIVARWRTDQGAVETRYCGPPNLSVDQALEAMAKRIESEGLFVVKLTRVYSQDVPVLGTKPAYALAGPMTRHSTEGFHVQHHLPWEEETSDE
jgi:hypothetical protein